MHNRWNPHCRVNGKKEEKEEPYQMPGTKMNSFEHGEHDKLVYIFFA